ncbi:oxidoreductase family protein [Apiospora marii]|uniref:Oxidoreductase family protein n=1 Tax=Apiospora marii TaxID=335849 RepID=A0ABR1RWB3_9PEZI
MAAQTLPEEGPVDLSLKPDNSDVLPPPPPPMSASPPRILVIGAGSRGRTYARSAISSSNGVVVAVAEPDQYKREQFARNFIFRGKSSDEPAPEGSLFADWHDFLDWEMTRREREKAGEAVPEGVDAVFVCVLDEMHHDVVVGLAPLGLHIMCEKPLATTLADCVAMYRALAPHQQSKVFSVGHVLRYSPHNILLRKLLLEDRAIGDILSVVHTEPVGWWHFSHSYVRGNWRKESTTAPSLLTKSCHDIDILLWLLCSPAPGSDLPPHLPSTVSSSGSLQFYKRSRKPKAAGNATNCLSCPIEKDCMYSSKSIYVGPRHMGLETGNTRWPISIVMPDIESFDEGRRKDVLMSALAEDYDESTPKEKVDGRNWFGRCVFESDNDVCDEQVVTMTWEEEPLTPGGAAENAESLQGRGSKQATFHMIAQTKKQCERYSYIYGTEGEVYADSRVITVEDFQTGETATHRPRLESLGHGGGDVGLTRQFILAVDRVKNHGWKAERAQAEYIGCTLEEVVRSHAMVFAAEEARTGEKVIEWKAWWDREVGQIE